MDTWHNLIIFKLDDKENLPKVYSKQSVLSSNTSARMILLIRRKCRVSFTDKIITHLRIISKSVCLISRVYLPRNFFL